jgi:hypothetical protein
MFASQQQRTTDYYAIGDKLAFNVTPNDAGPNDTGPNGPAGLATFQLRGQQDGEWDGRWNADDAKAANGAKIFPLRDSVTFFDNPVSWSLDAKAVRGRDISLRNFFINEDNGTVHAGEIVLSLGEDFDIAIANADEGDVLASFAQPLGI